jgi:N-carbamoyl-L-amino-acid hydrolase
MLSGAGHDAVSLSKVVPTGMIFIPCRKGISHSEKEFASRKDMIAGCNVLLKAVLKINKK